MVAPSASAARRPSRFQASLWLGVSLIALARLVGFSVYAFFSVPCPLEVFHFEAVMVHLARRVALGQALYPDWSRPPHVPNFYGPIAFWALGLTGRWAGLGIDGLFSLGRALSLGPACLTSVLVGLFVGKRYGRFAGWLGAVVSVGAAPMYGFAVMTRPDALAETLGFAGSWLGMGRSAVQRFLGGAVLCAAALTKQTAGAFLIATLAALLFAKRSRDTLLVLVGWLLAMSLIVSVVTFASEPNIAAALLGQVRLAPAPAALLSILKRLAITSPDLLVLPLLGITLWGLRGEREADLFAFSFVLVALGLISSIKPGSDLNYVLSLRLIAAMAVGKLWSVARGATGQGSLAVSVAIVVVACSIVPGVRHAQRQALNMKRQADILASPVGRSFVRDRLDACRIAADPNTRLLTDSGLLALYQGERAAFNDPWMFRALVISGQLDPKAIEDEIANLRYDYLILTSPLNDAYDNYEFGIPPALARLARERYVLLGARGQLFHYGRVEGSRSRDERGHGSP